MNYSSDILKEFSRIQRAMCDFPNHWLAVYFRECADTNNTDTERAGHLVLQASFDEGKHRSSFISSNFRGESLAYSCDR